MKEDMVENKKIEELDTANQKYTEDDLMDIALNNSAKRNVEEILVKTQDFLSAGKSFKLSSYYFLYFLFAFFVSLVLSKVVPEDFLILYILTMVSIFGLPIYLMIVHTNKYIHKQINLEFEYEISNLVMGYIKICILSFIRFVQITVLMLVILAISRIINLNISTLLISPLYILLTVLIPIVNLNHFIDISENHFLGLFKAIFNIGKREKKAAQKMLNKKLLSNYILGFIAALFSLGLGIVLFLPKIIVANILLSKEYTPNDIEEVEDSISNSIDNELNVVEREE
jgi:hypothetical protein